MSLQAAEPQQDAAEKNEVGTQRKQDKKLKVWEKITYSRPQQAIPGDFYYTSEKSLSEINCTTRTIRPLRKIYYGSDGNEIKSIHHGETMKPDIIVPDTPAESVFDFSCAFKPTKAAPQAKKSPTPQSKATAQPARDKPVTSKEKPKEQTPATAKTATKPAPTSPTTTKQGTVKKPGA